MFSANMKEQGFFHRISRKWIEGAADLKAFFNNLKIREKIFFITSLIVLGVCLISMFAI